MRVSVLCTPSGSGKIYIRFCLIIMEACMNVPAKTGSSYVAGAVYCHGKRRSREGVVIIHNGLTRWN